MEDQTQTEEVERSPKRTFILEVEVFADNDAELREIADDVGGEVFSRLDVIGVSVSTV